MIIKIIIIFILINDPIKMAGLMGVEPTSFAVTGQCIHHFYFNPMALPLGLEPRLLRLTVESFTFKLEKQIFHPVSIIYWYLPVKNYGADDRNRTYCLQFTKLLLILMSFIGLVWAAGLEPASSPFQREPLNHSLHTQIK